MTNKFMYSLAVIAISLSAGIFIPAQSQAAIEDSFTVGDLTYRVLTEDDTTGTVSVSCSNKDIISVVIPSSVENDGKTYTVTTIESRAFSEKHYLQGIKIPNSVTSIETFAFVGCASLESITIPASVTSLGDSPFIFCHCLACVYYEGNAPEVSPIPGELYDSAFAVLTSYYRAENKDSWEPLIDENNKWEERKIECIDKPVSGTKGIAYEYLEDGTAVVLGIGTASETDIVIPVTVENPNDGKTYVVRSIGNSAFQGTGITSLTMGSSIEMIGDNAFQSCTGLTKAMIGSCVRSMGENVFQDCSNLMEVYYDGYIPDIKGEIYTNTPQELISYYNKAEKIFWENATILGSWQNRKALCITETIPGTKELGFEHFTEEGTVSVFGHFLTSEKVVIPPTLLMGRRLFTVTTIMEKAFAPSTFTSIEIPDTITTIEPFAFQNCKNLTTIIIPKSVTSLGSYLFSGCSSLTGVYYQGDVPSVNGVMLYFSAPDSLISYYSIGNTSWENAVVDGYWMGRKAIPIKKIDDLIYLVLTEEEITGTVSVKSWGAVEGEIIIPDFIENEGITYKVTEIEDYAFYNCSNLTSITLPESIISIKDYAFYNCSNLTSITLPESIISIKDYAFYNCSSLLNIVISDSVTSIGSSAFAYCSSLTSITIPKSVASIGINVFSRCNNLTSVYYQGDVPSVNGMMLYAAAPNSLISYYPEGNATWEAVIENGQWQRRGTATWNPLLPAMAELTYSLDNGILTLSFTGTLEESDDTVNWIPVQEAMTPYVVDINKEKKFYRAVQ